MTILSGPEASLEQVQTYVKENPEIIHVGFQGSALLMAIQQQCPKEVILYLVHRSFPDQVHTSPLMLVAGNEHDSVPKDDNDQDNRNGSFWKLFLLAAVDETRHLSHPVVWDILNTFPQWIDCYTFLGHDHHHDQNQHQHSCCGSSGSGCHLFCGVMVWRPDVACDMIQRYPHLAHPQPHVSYYPLHATA